jgi:phenylacetate-CoA ligase
MTAWMDAVMWAAYEWHGIRPGQSHARFWGTPLSKRKRALQRVRDSLLHRRRLSAFELTAQNCAAFFATLRGTRPFYAYGYPNVIAGFAEQCRNLGLDGRAIGLRIIVCTGELLSPQARQLLESFFGCSVVNEYGCTESGVLAFECGAGSLHSIPVAAYHQISTSDGAPVRVGEPGELVVTDLYGSVAPLLRYRLHDWGTAIGGSCACGRSLPRLELQRGRIDSFIQTPSGPIYDAILAYNVAPGVTRFRVRQTAPDRLEAEIVVTPSFDRTATARDCQRRWEAVLGQGLGVSVEPVERIDPDRSGKLQYFVPLGG